MTLTTSADSEFLKNKVSDDAQHFLEKLFPEPKLNRALLVTPPDADNTIFNPEAASSGTYSNFPPYGLALLSNVLEDAGVECDILNLNHIILKACHEGRIKTVNDFDAMWKNQLNAKIEEYQPDFIGVTCMFTMTYNSFKAVCKVIGQSGIPLVIGGVAVTNDIEMTLNEVPDAKITVLNEGELVLKDLVRAIRREVDVGALGQVIFSDGGKRYHLDEIRRPTGIEIDAIPNFDKIQVGELSRYGVVGSYQAFLPKETRVATSLSNRGCRGRCTFCSVRSFNGAGVRHRSINSILNELEILKNEHGINHIMWLDDDLFKDHPRAISLFNGMVRRNLNMTWDASNGVLAVSCVDDVIAASVASGCIGLTIGIESGNNDILRSSLKPATVEINLRAAEVLNRFETIYSSAFIIIGFPNETVGMIQDTVNACKTMNLDWYRIKPLQPLPNTPVYEEMLETGQIIKEEDQKGVRYMTGAYGKAHEIEKTKPENVLTTQDIFQQLPSQHVPDKHEIEDIWFLMNYELNYARVAREDRPIKLKKQNQFLKLLCDVTAPNSALAFHTKCMVEKKLFNQIDQSRLLNLQSKLKNSPYWKNKFEILGLSMDDLTIT